MIRVLLPAHLANLARVNREIDLAVEEPITQRRILDVLESAYPVLRGTMRDQVSGERRPFIRFFACEQDLSHESPDDPVPDEVIRGTEPFMIIGAMAGG